MTTIDLSLLAAVSGGEPPAPGGSPDPTTGTGRPAATEASPPLTVDVLRQFCAGLDMQSRRARNSDPQVSNALARAADACFSVLPKTDK
ncbi:MAG TPA: hypothetical protein VL326_03495 [Kofleriaceae bacterium]|nr:hypothetical protein [Kofleriaceae bacterium]